MKKKINCPIIPLLTVFALLLTGCGRPPVNTLHLTMSLGEEEWKVLREEIFPPFEENYDVKIESYQIESGQLAAKLEALKSAGVSAVDVFAQDNMSLAALVNKDLVLDLSEYEYRIPKEVLPNLTGSCRFEDKLMFMPFRPNVQIVYYNENVFKKYDLEPPETWYELLKTAGTLKQEEGYGRLLLKGFGGNPTATQVYEFVLQAGGDPYSFNDKGCVDAFIYLKILAPFLSAESKRAKWDTTNDILARGEAHIAQNWPFGIVILVEKYGLDYIKTYSGWHGPAGEIHVIGGDVFGIPVSSENKEMALNFISYMQTKEVQEILVSRLGWPSLRNDAYGEVEEWQRPYFDSVKRALEHGVFRKNVTWWPAYEKYVTEAFHEIVLEDAPVEETLNKYKSRMEKDKALYR